MDPSSFPKKYGGELDWNWRDMPNLDEPTRALAGPLERVGEFGDREDPGKHNKATERSYVKGPVVWAGNQMTIYGTMDGKPRHRTIPADSAPEDSVPLAGSKLNGTKTEAASQEAQTNGTMEAST